MLENSSLVYCIATAKYGWEFPHVGGLVSSYIFDITVVMGIKLLFFMMLKRKIYLLIKVHYSAPFLTPITLVVVLSDLWQFGESKMMVFFFFFHFIKLWLTSYIEKWTLSSVSLIMADTKEVTKCAVLSQVRFLSFEIQATYLCLVLNVYF